MADAFTIQDVKSIAAKVKDAFPTDRPLTVEVSVRVFSPDTKEYMNLVLTGTPPGLTMEAVLNGEYLKFHGVS